MTDRKLSRDILSSSSLDRSHHRRSDGAWLARQLAAGPACVTLVWRGMHLLTRGEPPAIATLDPSVARPLCDQACSFVFLGEDDRGVWFALDLPGNVEPPPFLATLGEFRGLREYAPLLAARDASILVQARAMAHWHRHQRYCGSCGAPTTSQQGGNVRRCSAETCRREHFPRTDPAIIALVTNEDRCLLGRQSRWPEHLYSTLAGFVEPGESLEAAVAREVREEAGVRVDSCTYRYSQPWPFPGSLMIGFRARTKQATLTFGDELSDARWMTREDLSLAVAGKTLTLPAPFSISFRLIQEWFCEERDPEELEGTES